MAFILLGVAPLLPWNLYFGLGIPDSSIVLWGVLGFVTVSSLTSLLVSLGGLESRILGRFRLFLNLPYLLLVAAFIGYDVFESIRSGGTVHVPGGIGPGAWLGTAGALLAAQPVLTSPTVDEFGYGRWLRLARIIGYASMFGASLSAGFNLCWRIRFALQNAGGSESFGTQNTAVILTAVVYGAVALIAVLVASRWILRNTQDSRLVTLALGGSALVAGVIVWLLPVGREIDAFHGIEQNTSTAGVGYEGYLAWVAAAAVFVPLALFSSRETRADREIWRAAIRKGLALIVVWAAGSALMRVTDLIVAALLSYPYSSYDTVTLAAFDVITAVLAFALRRILTTGALRSQLITWLSGLLISLTVTRVILGIVLAARFQQAPNAVVNPVYGNNLVQQITSVFDVTLCGLALCIFVAIIVAGRLRRPRRRVRRQRPARVGPGGAFGAQRPRVPIPTRPGAPAPPSEASTTQFGVSQQHDAPTSVIAVPGPAPRIFRSGETTGPVRPKIYRPPDNPS